MSETAAQLVDHVLPHVPVRQWVLTLPMALGYRAGFDPALSSAILELFLRTVFGWLRRTAREEGVADGRAGAVTVIQRAGYRRSYCDSCTNMVWIGPNRAV